MKQKPNSRTLHLLLMCAIITLPLEPILAVNVSLDDDSKNSTKQDNIIHAHHKGEYAQVEIEKLLWAVEASTAQTDLSPKMESARKLNALATISAQEIATLKAIAEREAQKLREQVQRKEREAQRVLEQKNKEENKKKSKKKDKKKGNSFSAHVSAYTAAADETGGSGDGITASGARVQANHTIACPKSYAFGTKVHFDGYGTFVCEDRGGAIKGNKFDMYMHTKAEAFSFGRRNLTASIVQ